ncbi:hypothetical protein [Asaia lannensis]|uniref:hypothetical protein n=1 Tax=Asaia lannensis TaxID=415421 RepID=UPI001C9902F4
MSPPGQGFASIAKGLSVLALCCVTMGIVPALASDAPDCVEGAVQLPLLGGMGDAPVLPATLEGRPVAVYFSPGFDRFYVGNMNGFDTTDTRLSAHVTINGVHSETYPIIRAGHFRLGPIDMGTPDMIQQVDYPSQQIGKTPLIGVMGFNSFEHLSVLLDMPHGIFALIRFRRDETCKEAPSALMGHGTYSVPLQEKTLIPVSVGGTLRDFTLDPDVPVTTLPAKWLPPGGDMSRNITGHDGVALYGSLRSHIVPITGVRMNIGDLHLDRMTVYAQDDLTIGLLGMDFFQSHIALIDYPGNRVYFLPSTARIVRPGANLHFDRFRVGRARVTHAPKDPNRSHTNWPLTPAYQGQPG